MREVEATGAEAEGAAAGRDGEVAAGVRVNSEVGRLRRVLVHAPGPELTVVTPANRDDFLFDDLLDAESAARQHGRFQAVLERFAEVHDVADLLADALAIPEARAYLLGHAQGGPPAWASEASAAELARQFIEGREETGGRAGAESLSALVHEAGYVLPPLPNLFFTRDAAAVVGDRVMISAMKHGVRWTEELILRTLFEFHPLLGNGGRLYDGTLERRTHTSIEGGDVHVLRTDLVLLGMSERTTAAGIDALLAALFGRGEVRDALVVLLPPNRASIHLDMIFTAIDQELCCAFPPYFVGPTRLPVLHVSAENGEIREMPNLFTALATLGHPMEPIYCGGERRAMQEREQWGSGCNMVALAPGQLVAYDRNEHTLRALERDGGFEVVTAVDFLTGDVAPDEDGRFVIAIEGSELVRGGGGPRCMTLPIRREDPSC